ncbi:MAG: hypothetical protein ACRDTC_15925, partial [Pseudonocardiaceae bacterium]
MVLRCLREGGREEGSAAFLKIVPDVEIARIEAIGLRAWHWHPGVVELLDADLNHGALLLEEIEPGIALSERNGPVRNGPVRKVPVRNEPVPWDVVIALLRQLPIA